MSGNSIWHRHFGSTTSVIVGSIILLNGLDRPHDADETAAVGAMMVLAGLAYRSAKRRYLGEVTNSAFRQLIEAVLLLMVPEILLAQTNFLSPTRTAIIQLAIAMACLFLPLFMIARAWNADTDEG